MKDRRCYISIAPFEASLLERIAQPTESSALTGHTESSARKALFEKWRWADRIISEFRQQLTPEMVADDFDGDIELGYRNCLHTLSHLGLLGQSRFRASAFRRLNPALPDLLRSYPVQSLEFAPAPADDRAWTALMELEQQEHLHFSRESFGSKRTFDIFKSVYSHDHASEHASSSHIRLEFLKAVTKQWEIKVGTDSGEPAQEHDLVHQSRLRYLFRSKLEVPLEWPQDKPYSDREGGYTDEYLTYLLRKSNAQSWLEGVLENIPVIRFEDLRECSVTELRKSDVNLSIPFDEKDNYANLQWKLWKPMSNTAIASHLLHTEDEVYQYCIVHDWYFPDHFYQGQVIFAARPLDDTEFVSKLKHFWASWNDCCLTWDPGSQQLYLLETIPGLRFRARARHQDMEVALRYFRNLVEAHAAGRLNDTAMQDLLGADYYNTLFAHSLQYIPSEQIILHPSPLIGEGRNGRVYRATWHRPAAAVLETSQQNLSVQVALKAIKSAGLGPKFVQEMDLTYTSVGGGGAGCVDLYGISTVPASALDNPSSITAANTLERTVVLVTQYATLGSIRDYLRTKLPQTTYTGSWELIVDMLSSIANGLHTLHRHDVIHRDLHLNNVLVTRTHYPDQPEKFSWEDAAKIADIGEGRHIVSKLSGAVLNASVEARDFHAPEIVASRTWTTASDVFAFGVIGCKFLELREQLCPEKAQQSAISEHTAQALHTGDAEASLAAGSGSVVPLAVAEIVSSALARDPAERWSSREYADKFGDLSMDFHAEREEPDSERVQWTTLDWWDVFEQAFSSRQAKSRTWKHRGIHGEESSTWTLPEDTPTD